MKWTSREIRRAFLDFFRSKGHEIVPSSPIVLPTDPTLLFANAGMNQFKEIFLGHRESRYRRVADTQKCIRVSGKHNDLEEVGRDTYHHTFFEMLGNWSFGDYYKREAIAWAWELLTEIWKLPKDRLWATVYREDDEAESLWKEVTDILPHHILRFDEKDNFWEMGDTGPCGPCSEIHIDLTPNGCGPELINAGTAQAIELWNLVFIQYNRKGDGSLEELPSKHVDTGMGFERMCAVLQGVGSNYDTDLFTPLIERIRKLSGKPYAGEDAVAMRVIADHLRALSFAIGDGVMPSNDGRGYVLRRLLRRAVRYGRKLGLDRPFMGDLFPVLEQVLGEVFPELGQRRREILKALEAEEASFAVTLDRGMALFDQVVAGLKQAKETEFPGEEAFKLYDTFGFPLDLTTLMAAEHNLEVDALRVEELMEQQRERARAARKADLLREDASVAEQLARKGVHTQFVGYDTLETETEIVAILAAGGEVGSLREGEEGAILLRATPFYAEAGGQVGDHGILRGPRGEFEVWDTRRPAEGVIIHLGRMVQGDLAGGECVAAVVDHLRRARLIRHHSATHLLNCALRELVSPSVRQAGSLVAPDRLRFDFTHYEAIPAATLHALERRVNEWIMQDDKVTTYPMDLKDVPQSGIIAVFDEKYGDVVRVVDIGGYSRELCGGTHVRETGQLGCFRIVSESSVAAGVRRIEAVCGWPALELTHHEHELVHHLAHRFSVSPGELKERVETLLEHNRKLERELKQRLAESAQRSVGALLESKIRVEDVEVIVSAVPDQDQQGLRAMLDKLQPQLPNGVIVLGSAARDKVVFVAAVGAELVKRGVHAGKLVGEVARVAGGGGGGQPHMAQAGGKQPEKLEAALQTVPDQLRRMLDPAGRSRG